MKMISEMPTSTVGVKTTAWGAKPVTSEIYATSPGHVARYGYCYVGKLRMG